MFAVTSFLPSLCLTKLVMQDRVFIKRRDDKKEVISASVGFDFMNFSFFAEREGTIRVIKSFNNFLMEFLGVRLS